MSRLRELYLLWRGSVAQRSLAGELRASPAEREALEAFTAALEEATAEDRARWEVERVAIDASETSQCSCGHPIGHHDASGSCFHVVGCSTGCDCVRV